MTELLPKLGKVMDSALLKACSYFDTEFALKAASQPVGDGNTEALYLREMTAIVGIGGAIDLYIAFSFEDSLVQELYEKMTAGLQIDPAEEYDMKQATIGEIVNIIMGHSTMDLQGVDKKIISLTPPIVLDFVKTVPKLKNAVFHLRTLATTSGIMDVYLIGPKDLFSENLDYIDA